MKKYLFLLIVSLISIDMMAQEAVCYSKVISAEDKDASQLYQNVKFWISSNYPYASKVIQLDDPRQKMISLLSTIDYDRGGVSGL